MSDYFHEQMVNKMLEPKERDLPCKECFIFKIEEERVKQFIANYKAQRTFFRNAEIIQALEDVRAEIEEQIDRYDDRNISEYEDCLAIIDRKIAEVKGE